MSLKTIAMKLKNSDEDSEEDIRLAREGYDYLDVIDSNVVYNLTRKEYTTLWDEYLIDEKDVENSIRRALHRRVPSTCGGPHL